MQQIGKAGGQYLDAVVLMTVVARIDSKKIVTLVTLRRTDKNDLVGQIGQHLVGSPEILIADVHHCHRGAVKTEEAV